MIVLHRYAYAPFGTYGVWMMPDAPALWTVECPWRQNATGVSCLPEGNYTLAAGTFHRNTADPSDDYPCLELRDVPGRTLCKVHRANWPSQLEGCIAPGRLLAANGKEYGVSESTEALNEILKWFGSHAESELRIQSESSPNWRP